MQTYFIFLNIVALKHILFMGLEVKDIAIFLLKCQQSGFTVDIKNGKASWNAARHHIRVC